MGPRNSGPVSNVIFRTVKAGRERDFETLAREANAQRKEFPGHVGVDVIAPPPGERPYAVIVRFDGGDNLNRWEESPERATLVAPVDPRCDPKTETKGLTGWIAIPDVLSPPRRGGSPSS